MKRFLPLFFIALLGLGLSTPSLSFAQDTLSCDAGTVECYCPPSIATDDIDSNPIDPTDALTVCENTCYDLAIAESYLFSDIESWAVQCEVGGVLTAVSGGRVDFIEDISDRAREGINEGVGDRVAPPRLGIEIPGFDSSLTTSYISYGEYQTNVLGHYVKAVYAWLISAGAIIAVLMMMIAGVQYMLAGGNQGALGQAKKRIVDAISGLVLLLGAFTIAFLIDPSTVAFETLKLKNIEQIDFDHPNETPVNFGTGNTANGGRTTLSSTPSEGGIGWNGVPSYDQTQFADFVYGEPGCFTATSGNIKSSGCGATAYAMAASHLSGQVIDPETVAFNWSKQGSCPGVGTEYGDRCRACRLGDCNSCNGTFGSAFTDSNLQSSLDLSGEAIGTHGAALSQENQEEIRQLLGDGELIITSYRTESGGGHYILLVGLDEDGNFLANNPWGGTMEVRDSAAYFAIAKSFYHIFK